MLEKGKTYTVTKDGLYGCPAKILSIMPEHRHPYKCRVKTGKDSSSIVYLNDEELSAFPNPKGRKKKKSITETLQRAAVADHRMELDRKAEEFDRECQRMTELAKQASEKVMAQVESGELVVNSDQELRDAAYALYKQMGGTDVLTAYTTEKAPESEKVVYSVEITPEAAQKIDEREEKKEMETTKKVKFAEIEVAIKAISRANACAGNDEHLGKVLADLALKGLKSEVVGKEVVED